jgi:hypothetical protein
VPGYDQWFDGEHVRRWSEEHDVGVTVDHIPYNSVSPRAAAEVSARGPHDIFGFLTRPLAAVTSTVAVRLGSHPFWPTAIETLEVSAS